MRVLLGSNEEKLLYVKGYRKRAEKELANYLFKYKEEILAVAKSFKVDPYLFGAILIDEEMRRDWVDGWVDLLAMLGRNSSVGVAQIKVVTARELVKK